MAQSKKPAPKKKDYNPYGKAQKGESKQARAKRQKSYFSYQREHAEETGDQAMVDRIYAKLGQPSHNVNANQTDQMALGAVPAMAGLPGLIRAIAPMLGALAARGGPAAQRVPALARPMQRPGMPQQPALPAPQRALPSPQRALPSQAGRSVSPSPLNRESGAPSKGTVPFKAKPGRVVKATKSNHPAVRGKTSYAVGNKSSHQDINKWDPKIKDYKTYGKPTGTGRVTKAAPKKANNSPKRISNTEGAQRSGQMKERAKSLERKGETKKALAAKSKTSKGK